MAYSKECGQSLHDLRQLRASIEALPDDQRAEEQQFLFHLDATIEKMEEAEAARSAHD